MYAIKSSFLASEAKMCNGEQRDSFFPLMLNDQAHQVTTEGIKSPFLGSNPLLLYKKCSSCISAKISFTCSISLASGGPRGEGMAGGGDQELPSPGTISKYLSWPKRKPNSQVSLPILQGASLEKLSWGKDQLLLGDKRNAAYR